MKGNGPMYALWLILTFTMACGSENQGDLRPAGELEYDPKTVTTVSGEVLAVDKSTDMGYGKSLILKTSAQTFLVYLGPGWFLDKQDLTFAPRDQLEITGSQVTLQGKPAIIATQVKKGDQSLKLRDPAGIPAWAGAADRSPTIIGKWLLQEMIVNSEFKHPHETAEKKWGNLEIFPNNTLEFYSSGTQGRWTVLNDGRIKVISDYWGTFFLSIEKDNLIMAFLDDPTKYIYKKIPQ